MAQLVGVLALQGAFVAHARVLAQLGCDVREVRLPEHLSGLAALCMPGGESTTMSLLLDTTGLREPLRLALAPHADGGQALPVLATCAGAILLAQRLSGDSGSRKVDPLGLLDATVSRNAFGRQVDSFEADLRVDWSLLRRGAAVPRPPNQASTDGSIASAQREQHGSAPTGFHAVFIRAPRFTAVGPAARACGWLDDEPVLVRQGNLLAATFHPELSGDTRLHAALLELAAAA